MLIDCGILQYFSKHVLFLKYETWAHKALINDYLNNMQFRKKTFLFCFTDF